MRTTTIFLIALAFSFPVAAQDAPSEQRSNHYLDHVVLGVNNLDKGMDDFREITGVTPKKDGTDATFGTHSAIVGLGENMFLEIIAPDPKADPDLLNPELRELVYDRLQTLDSLTPFRWAIGTSNLERTTKFMRRASSRPSEVMAGSRDRGWGRDLAWTWVKVNVPDSHVTPFFVQWDDMTKRPQSRAPEGCTLDELHINSRNYKSLLNLVATMQVAVDLTGSEEDSLSFALDCPRENFVFEHLSLEIKGRRSQPQRSSN